MNLSHDILPEEFELIEQHLRQDMTEAQAAAFREKTETDPSWPQKIRDVQLLMTALIEQGLAGKLEAYHASVNMQTDGQAGKRKIVPLYRQWWVAASLLLLVSLGALWVIGKDNQYEKLYKAYYAPDPGLMTAMGPAENYNFESGMVEYKSGEYRKAIEHWTPLLKEHPQNDTLQYFLGAACQATGEDDQAEQYLRQVTNTKSIYYKDACWYLGMLLVKNGKIQEAVRYIDISGYPKRQELIARLLKK